MERASTFGQWLKHRRHDLNLTQEAVAEAAGCSSDTIRKLESGVRRPSGQIAELLAGLLEVEPLQRPAFLLWARGLLDTPPPSLTTVVGQERSSQRSPQATGLRLTPAQRLSSSLPLPLTRLVGRERELTRARSLLRQPTTRLLTVVGSPGIGKTSLSIALASTLRADFKDGLLYLPLGPISDPALVATTLAEALGVHESASLPLIDSLRDALKEKQILLILDNFEHVVAAAPLLSDLLTAAPQLKILTTSRAPLHLRGEKLLKVPPLDVPDPEACSPIEELERTGSVALFVERASDIDSVFELTPDNAPVIAAICARLEGLPLAIELAAARTRILSLPSLLSRLQRRSGQLDVLKGGARDAPAHQRTLRDALESSYSLLGPGEQRLFRRLGIFAGPFTFEAAEEVAGATLDSLETVLDQSLLRVHAQSSQEMARQNAEGETLYAMLMPLREYALEQLAVAGESQDVAFAHARYFLSLSRAAEQEMTGSSQKVWMDRIAEVYGDIRAALDWSLKNEQVEMVLRIAGGIRHFWIRSGYRQEGRRWVEQALGLGQGEGNSSPAAHRRAESVQTDARVEGLNALSALLHRQGAFVEAERYISEAVALSRGVGDESLLSGSLLTMGLILTDLGELERAAQALQECISICEKLGDQLNAAKALGSLGRVATYQQETMRAIALQEQALAIRRQLGIPSELAESVQNLGVLALKQGDYHRAISYAEESATLSSQVGDKESTTYSLGVVGKAAFELGQYEKAALYFSKCLSAFVELGAMGMVAFVFEEIARVAIGMAEPAKAVRLFGVAEALRASVGASVAPPDRPERDENIASLRNVLGEHQFNAAWTVGRSMPLEEAISYAQGLSTGRVRTEGTHSPR